MNIAENTAERLRYYSSEFTNQVMGAVAIIAEQQSRFSSYDGVLADVGIPSSIKVVDYDGYHPFQMLDRVPFEWDEDSPSILVHLAHGNPLDYNQQMQIAPLAARFPHRRILARGRASGPGYWKYDKLTKSQRDAILTGDHRPYIDPMLKYMEENDIDTLDEVAYSGGNLSAVEIAKHGNLPVKHLVAIEPVMGRRTLTQLGSDFMSTNKPLKGYVNASGLETFIDARKNSVGLIAYGVGLARPTNIAHARAMAKGDFERRQDEALKAQPNMKVMDVWGSASELATDGLMHSMVQRQRERYNTNKHKRVRSLSLRGQKHALANDIYLQLAIADHGLAF